MEAFLKFLFEWLRSTFDYTIFELKLWVLLSYLCKNLPASTLIPITFFYLCMVSSGSFIFFFHSCLNVGLSQSSFEILTLSIAHILKDNSYTNFILKWSPVALICHHSVLLISCLERSKNNTCLFMLLLLHSVFLMLFHYFSSVPR